MLGLAGIDFDKPVGEIIEGLDTAVKELGLVGVCMEPGLARAPMYADDEKLFPLYEKIEELKVPLLFMTVSAVAAAPRPLPWGSPLFGGTIVSLLLFAIGGVMGLIGFTQDTRVPAHYHGMVGAVTLAYMALTPLLLGLTGRRPLSERWARWQPYLYGLGLLGIMAGMHWAGGHGAPRKTFGFSWANAQAIIGMNLMGLGSVLALAGGLAFVINMGAPLFRKAR